MSGFEVHPVTGAALKALHRQHLSRDFPRNELKPLSMLEELTEQGINSVWAVEQEDTLIAYYVLARLPGASVVLLDYFAVEPAFRGSGVGTKVLRWLANRLHEGEYLLIESEWPPSAATEKERAVRERRLDFYRRCGAEWSGVCSRLFGVDYALLTIGARTQTLEVDYRALYRAMVPEHWLDGHLETFCPQND